MAVRRRSKTAKLLLPGLILLAVFGYYLAEVLIARGHTIDTARRCLSNGRMAGADLTDRQLEILIGVQDPNFHNHRGVDLVTPGTGWTTITQSLAKVFYFRKFRQGLPKIKQTLCARFALHPLVSKEDQLSLFVNLAYLGNGRYGLADAAEYYYACKVSELSEDEYISLIASLISPTTLNVKDNPAGNRERTDRIRKMLAGEYVPRNLFDITYTGGPTR